MTDALLAKRAGLSKREFDILGAVVRGLSNREIARELWISEPTVKFHLTSVYRKLDVANPDGRRALGPRQRDPASGVRQARRRN